MGVDFCVQDLEVRSQTLALERENAVLRHLIACMENAAPLKKSWMELEEKRSHYGSGEDFFQSITDLFQLPFLPMFCLTPSALTNTFGQKKANFFLIRLRVLFALGASLIIARDKLPSPQSHTCGSSCLIL